MRPLEQGVAVVVSSNLVVGTRPRPASKRPAPEWHERGERPPPPLQPPCVLYLLPAATTKELAICITVVQKGASRKRKRQCVCKHAAEGWTAHDGKNHLAASRSICIVL